MTFTLSSCFKDYNERVLLKDNWVEFDLATSVSKASGKNYPIVPGVDKLTGYGKFRINMTGLQSNVDQEIDFKVVEEESNAVEGYHYSFAANKKILIPANSSFGYLEIYVHPEPTGSALLVVELLPNDNFKVMENYKAIGIPLDYLSIIPDPSTVHDMGTFIKYDSVTVGSYSNNSIGAFVNMQTGAVHSRTQSSQDSHLIDLNYQWSGSNNANFMSIAGSEIVSFGAPINNIVSAWPTRNETTFIRYTNIDADDELIYENITSGADIETAYNNAVTNVASRSGYSATTFGPGRRVRDMQVGDIIFFRSIERDYYAIIRIKSIVTGAPGSITFEYKTQKL